MTRHAMLCAALLLAAPAAAQDQPAVDQAAPEVIDPREEPEDFDLARKKVVDCEGEKFVFAWGAGARPTKVTLCSKKDATPEELVKMLDDAAKKLEQTASIVEDRRVAIVQQIRAKIAELQGAPAAAAAGGVAGPAVTVPNSSFASTDRVPAPPTEYGSLPKIASAAPKPPAQTALARTPPAKPRLAFDCYTPGEIATSGRCVTMSRDTRLTIKAREAVPGDVGLRFRRNGETRAEVALNAMRNGQTVRLAMPRELCSGVVEAESQIEVVRSGHVVETMGPYLLRC